MSPIGFVSSREKENIMKKIKGFTLLEILIVVVIVSILASLAIPRYQKSVEHAKGSEAIANLNILRGAELRYFGEYDVETNNLINLDVENPNFNAKYFSSYSLNIGPSISDGNFTITATRNSGIYNNSWISLNQNGIYSGNWPFIP